MNNILNLLTNRYHKHLLYHNSKDSERAYNYLVNERGLSEESIKHFKIGFCEFAHGYNVCEKSGYSHEDMINSGMFLRGKSKPFERFRHMITFPVIMGDNTVHFTGRYIRDDWMFYNQYGPHKHMPGIFPCAYNHNCINNGYETPSIFIVESPIDAITLDQAGFNSIATFGVNGLSKKTVQLLKDKEIYIAFDTDPNLSGQNGATRTGDFLASLGIKCKIITIQSTEKMDINTLFTQCDDARNMFVRLIGLAHQHKPTVIKEKGKAQNTEFNIIDIAARYEKLKQTSGGYMCKCPYHSDKAPSMKLYTNKNDYFCFGCGKAGNAVQLFIAFEEKLGKHYTKSEAIRFLRSELSS